MAWRNQSIPWMARLLPLLCVGYFFRHYHSVAYLIGSALVLGGVSALDQLEGRWPRIRNGLLSGLAAALALMGLPALGLWQFLQLSDIGDLDHASYSTALWNFAHGRFDYAFEGMNMLGMHSQYTSALWIPLQMLAGEVGLKIGEGLCLIIAAILVAARFRNNRYAASWILAAVLLSPAIASQFFFGFHPEFIGAPFLILAMQAYREMRLGRFLALTAFLAFSKESYTLAIAGLLLVAIVERRGWKWILLPGILCCLQMAVYWYGVVPRFAPDGNFLKIFFPESLGQVLSLWWSADTALFVFHVTLPFLPLMLWMPKRYLLLPIPLFVFYASFPDPLFRVVWPNYAFVMAFMCAGGLVLERNLRIADALRGKPGNGGAQRTDGAGADGRVLIGPFDNLFGMGRIRIWFANNREQGLDPRLVFTCALMAFLCYPQWKEILSVPGGNLEANREVETLRSLIPPEASLLINAGFTARLAARKEVALWGERSVWGKRPHPIEYFEYILLDTRFHPYWLVDAEDLEKRIADFTASPLWEQTYAQHGIYLFHRTEEARTE